MFSLAALYVLLDAHFIGAIQVLVYAGAIMVRVPVRDHAAQPRARRPRSRDARGKWGGSSRPGWSGSRSSRRSFALTRARVPDGARSCPTDTVAEQVRDARRDRRRSREPLFNEYLLAFELTSILLLAAIVGAVVLGKRRSVPMLAEVARPLARSCSRSASSACSRAGTRSSSSCASS